LKFPIAIEQGDFRHIWGVVVPDLPGCFSGSNRGIKHAIDNSKEAIELWIETALGMGQLVPQPSLISKFHLQNEYSGWIWATVEIDTALLSDEMKRFTPLL
jgi:predicted RNase H-like HicB family nuclease